MVGPSRGRASFALIAALAVLGAVACSPSPPPPPTTHQLAGKALGTTWTVKWVGEGADAARVQGVIEARLAEVDRQMSTWRPDSDLSRARATEGPVRVDDATAEVVRAALALAADSGGAFDPTVQPLVELWGIHHGRREAAPSEAELEAARAQVDWRRVVVGGEPGAATLDDGGTALDLSAIAKGYAVDRVSQGIRELGLARHMVEVGGEVRVGGEGPAGAWRLGVDDPEAEAPPGVALAAVVSLRDAALATSGNYRNHYEVDGIRVVHTLDPRVGRPVQSDVLSASVVAPTCMEADGLATALMVLGTDGLRLIEARPGVEALLLHGGGRRTTSSGMDAWLAGTPRPE